MKILHILFWNIVDQVGGTEIYLNNLLEKQKLDNECHVLMPGIGKQYSSDHVCYYESQFLPIHGDFNFLNGVTIPINFANYKEFIANLNPEIVYFHSFWPKYFHHLQYLNELNIQTCIIPHMANFTCLRGDLLQNGEYPCDGKVEITKCYKCNVNGRLIKKYAPLNFIHRFLGGKYRGYYNIDKAFFRGLSKKFQVVRFVEVLSLIAQSNTKILPISNWYMKVLEKNGYKVDDTFVNGPNDYRYLSKPKPKHNLNLLFVGRITKSKGFDVLDNLMDMLDNKRVNLTIVGPVQDEFSSSRLLSKPNVNYLGTLNRIGVQLQMKNADLLIVPSIAIEMRPLVLLEAIDNNLFPIGSNIGGIKDIIDEYGGELFDVGDVDALKATVNSFLK